MVKICLLRLGSPLEVEHWLKALWPCPLWLGDLDQGTSSSVKWASQGFSAGLPDSLSALGAAEPGPMLGMMRMLMVTRIVTGTTRGIVY